MEPIGQHFNFRLVNDRVIAPTAEQRLLMSQSVLAAAKPFKLLNFNLADTHFHAVCIEPLEAAKELVRRIKVSVSQRLRLRVPFAAAHFEPIYRQSHLKRAFWYTFEQQQRHGLRVDALREGSNLPDLIGLRLLGPQTRATVREYLPRVRRQDLLAFMRLDGLREASGPPELIPIAARDATGLLCIDGKSVTARTARRAAVAVASDQVNGAELARLLGQDRRSIARLLSRSPNADQAYVRAIRLQLGARSILGSYSRGELRFVA